MNDTGAITDKSLLPITALEYGPMEHEAQHARLKLGALTCQPLAKEYFDAQEHIQTIQVII